MILIAIGAVPFQHILQAEPGVSARICLHADVDKVRIVYAVHAAGQVCVLSAQTLLQVRLHILSIEDIIQRTDIGTGRLQL